MRSVPLSAYTRAHAIHERIQKDFAFPLKERLHVAPEVAMFRIGEDESIWKQAKDERYEFQIYFDGEYISSAASSDSMDFIWLAFLKGFKEKYKAGKIHLDPNIYKIEEEARKAEERAKQLKAAEGIIKNASSPEEHLVNEAFKEIKKRKGGKRGKKISV